MDMTAAWYIDAWSPVDGAIFATRRTPEQRESPPPQNAPPPGHRTDHDDDFVPGQNTVFMCVPEIRPIPIGRRSTALAATRRHFQFGFTELENGTEIAFDNLEQVRELVRRGYLAGGMGPDGPALPPGPNPEPTPNDEPEPTPDRGNEVDYDQLIDDSDNAQWTNGTDPFHDLIDLVSQNGEGRQRGSLVRLVSAYAQAVTVRWRNRVTVNDSAVDRRLYREWHRTIRLLGLADFRRRFDDLYPTFDGWPGDIYSWPVGLPEASLAAVVHAAPLPLRAHWRATLTRLDEKLLLPMADRWYFTSNRFLPELAPSILAALVMTARQVPEPGRVALRLSTAASWLADQLPTVALPAAADAAIASYISIRLREYGGPSQSNDGPTGSPIWTGELR